MSTTRIPGVHHVTAISGAAQENVDFYTGVLGLRLVKTTVNFDDPGTYHLYYGDRTGVPGTILTFFPWANAVPGQQGAGMANAVSFAIPEGALPTWQERLAGAGIETDLADRFGSDVLTLNAPDGLPLELVPTPGAATLQPWTHGGVGTDAAIRGFFGTTLPAVDLPHTRELLTDVFGWIEVGENDNRVRLSAPASAMGDADPVLGNAPLGRVVDLLKKPALTSGRMGKGTVHHVAFRARDDDEQAYWQDALRERGIEVTDVKDRQYFRSIYFRDKRWTSGVLFEIATDAPGFTHDEAEANLGTDLKLPPSLESRREELEETLPTLDRPELA